MLNGGKVQVGDIFLKIGQARELEVVGREQGVGADGPRQMDGRGPGQREPVIGAGAAADLIHEHQAVRGRVVEDSRRFGHLHHEGGAAAGQIIGRADAGKDAVNRPDNGLFGRHITADVGEYDDQCRLPHIGRFAAHIRAGNDPHRTIGLEG